MRELSTSTGRVAYLPLEEVVSAKDIARLPFVVRVFLENVLRYQGCGAEERHIDLLLRFPEASADEFPFHPARIVLQDFTGVPSVADLAALRAAVDRHGGDPQKVNPKIPVD